MSSSNYKRVALFSRSPLQASNRDCGLPSPSYKTYVETWDVSQATSVLHNYCVRYIDMRMATESTAVI